MVDEDAFLAVASAAACLAGAEALSLRGAGLATDLKSDWSPVTQADRRAESIIAEALARHWPGIPVVAEEACAAGFVPALPESCFFLVDPIDGTREFIAGRDEFTVNVALVESHRAIAGVVYAPALGALFTGSAKGAYRRTDDDAPRPIRVDRRSAPLRALASRSHRTEATDRFLAGLDLASVAAVGSSLKFCRLAEGAADVYPCFGPTMEWDTAAGQAVLEAAGGGVLIEGGGTLRYGKVARPGVADFRNPSFVALGGVTLPV